MLTKTLAAIGCFVATTVAGHAQTAPAKASATDLTREMSTRLRLNEGQYVRLLSLNRTRMQRQHEIEQATKSDASARTAQLAELQSQYELECSRLLSPSQLSQLQQDESQATGMVGGKG